MRIACMKPMDHVVANIELIQRTTVLWSKKVMQVLCIVAVGVFLAIMNACFRPTLLLFVPYMAQ
jgi:hypothetical protein